MKEYFMSLDASTTCTGFAVFCEEKLIKYGKIKPDKNLDWRDRVIRILKNLEEILSDFNINKIYIEDVPLKKQGGTKTLVQLGFVQGAITTLCEKYGISEFYIPVSRWRSDVGLFDKTEDGKRRNSLKIASINKANELFDLDLKVTLTKNGNYNEKKSDDDIADAILIGASQIEKYKVK